MAACTMAKRGLVGGMTLRRRYDAKSGVGSVFAVAFAGMMGLRYHGSG